MEEKMDKLYLSLNNYLLIILVSLLGLILIFNSIHVNNQKNLIKLNKKRNKPFDKIITQRKLEKKQDESELSKNSDKKCKDSNSNLRDYYNTGNIENFDDLDNYITYENEDKKYIKY